MNTSQSYINNSQQNEILHTIFLKMFKKYTTKKFKIETQNFTFHIVH